MILFVTNSPKLIDVNFVPISIHQDEQLNDIAKFYLTYNTIGNKANGTNPLIIINSSNPKSILSKFDNEKYYDNFFILTDTFGNLDYSSLYQFKYTYLFVANHSEVGYKLSGNIGIQDILSLQTMNIYNICYLIGPLFNKYIQYGNNNYIRFNSSIFINMLNEYKYIVDGLWFDKYVVCETIYHTDGDNILKHSPSVVNHQWNPENTSFADNTFDYSYLANTTQPKYNYSSNLSYTLSNKKTNLLTNAFDIIVNENDYENIYNMYIKYGTYDLSRIDFQKYYIFNNINKIVDVAIKRTITITQNVSDIIYNNESNTTYDIPVSIPVFTGTRKLRSRDITNYSKKTEQNISYNIPSQTITIDNCFDTFIILYYNVGNICKDYKKSISFLNMTRFNEADLVFEYIQPVWVYVTMTWNVIKTINIGDQCYIRDPTDPETIIMDASGNSTLYYVRSIINDNTVTISTSNYGNGTITKLKKDLFFSKDLPTPPP